MIPTRSSNPISNIQNFGGKDAGTSERNRWQTYTVRYLLMSQYIHAVSLLNMAELIEET